MKSRTHSKHIYIRNIITTALLFLVNERCYWQKKIARESKDSRRLRKTVSTVIGCSRAQRLPFSAKGYLCHLKSQLFGWTHTGRSTTEYNYLQCNVATDSDLKALLLAVRPKSSTLDPIPTFLIHGFIEELLPFLVRLCEHVIRRFMAK